MKKTEEKVIKFISSASLITEGDKILIALSGGPDSVFLIYFLIKFQNKYKIRLGAFHLNHKLRGRESDLDQKFCKDLCKKFKVRFFSKVVDVKAFAKKRKMSVEEAGRYLRYDELNKIFKQNNFTKIATAHIKDDNSETVLLNLIKGTGITGMTGIPASRDNIIRPALCLTKDEIFDYLHLYKISYRVDESNFSSDYERNFLRHNILPKLREKLNPSLDDAIFYSARIFQSFKDYLEKDKNEFLNKVINLNNRSVALNIPALKKFHNAVVTESIRDFVRKKWNLSLNFTEVQRILELASKQTGTSVQLMESLSAFRDRNSICLTKEFPSHKIKPLKLSVGKEVKTQLGIVSVKRQGKRAFKYSISPEIEYISGDDVSQKLVVRKWKNGDRFFPLGMKGEKKVSDFFIDSKMSRFEKNNQLILADGDKIIWIIGRRLDNRYKITAQTEKVLKLCWIPVKN